MVFVITGADKADAVRAPSRRSRSADAPASLVRGGGSTVVLLDAAAASGLHS